MADGLRAEAAAARGLASLYDYNMSSSARARVRARVRNKEKDALECNAVWNRAQRDDSPGAVSTLVLIFMQYKIQNYTSSTWNSLIQVLAYNICNYMA